jgi:hypothetical protein
MVENSGQDHDQEPKSDSTGYPSHSLVSTRRDDPREMRDTHNASEDALCASKYFSQPKTFVHASRIREAYLSKESSDLPPHPVLKNELKKGVSDVISNPSPAWLLVDFGSK